VKRVAVIGAAGQLGSALVKVLEERGLEPVPFTRGALDVCDHDGTKATLAEARPDAVINTAAYLAVDLAEDEVTQAFAVNAIAVKNLALVTAALDVPLVHVSTDYVFGADASRSTPYTETDAPGPQGVYGNSKLAGEYFVREYAPKHYVVRSAGLYETIGSRKKGGNFIETMLKLAAAGRSLKVVEDQVLTPTYTPDLAAAIVELLRTEAYGLYHATNGGDCSWYAFAGAIFELAGVEADLSPTTTAEYGAKAPRPAYSVLDNTKLHAAGVTPLRSWRDALAAYLSRRNA
jgi:dTDP-4-dehydrorhamnose reductase